MRTLVDLSELTEKQWARQVADLADLFGYRRYHTYRSDRSPAGFPDEVLVGRGRILFAELKRQPPKSKRDPAKEVLSSVHRLSPLQRDWLDDLTKNGAETYVWVPSDYDEIGKILGTPGKRITPWFSTWLAGVGRADGRQL